MSAVTDVESLAEASQVAQQAVGEATRAARTVSELREANRRQKELVRLLAATVHQANVVALNALSEAGRFGEDGGGIALVAQELTAMARETLRMAEEMDRQRDAMDSVLNTAMTTTAAVGGNVQGLASILLRLAGGPGAS